MGFKITEPTNVFSWYKWVAFKNGIGPDQFRKGQMRDWIEIMEIDNAISERELRQSELNKLMGKIRRG